MLQLMAVISQGIAARYARNKQVRIGPFFTSILSLAKVSLARAWGLLQSYDTYYISVRSLTSLYYLWCKICVKTLTQSSLPVIARHP